MIIGVTLTPGRATGRCLVLTTPLSLWGGTDSAGRVCDARHPQFGASLSGRVLVMESGRGSSSSSSVLAEQIRTNVAPVGILLAVTDPILVLGAMVARELYGHALPIVVVDRTDLNRLVNGQHVQIDAETDTGHIHVLR